MKKQIKRLMAIVLSVQHDFYGAGDGCLCR